MRPYLIQLLGQDAAQNECAASFDAPDKGFAIGNKYIGLNVGQNEIALAARGETFSQVGDYELGFNEMGVLSRVTVANRDSFRVEVDAENLFEAERRSG